MVAFFYFLFPKRFYTYLMGKFSLLRGRFFKRLFVRLTGIDLSIALKKNIDDYRNIQSIFIRRIDLRYRPLLQNSCSVVSPVDGRMLCSGSIQNDQVMQVKGIQYSLESLIGESSQRFFGGSYANFYLSPKDYHCFHAPVNGVIKQVRYVPGSLYPVKDKLVYSLSDLYVRNERVVLMGQDEKGMDWVFVAIGAMGVGSIHLCIDHQKCCVIKNNIDPLNWSVKKGEMLGCFSLGSSVVFVASDLVQWKDFSKQVFVREDLGSFT